MYKTYYDVKMTTVSGDVIVIKKLTNSTLISASKNESVTNIEIIKEYDKKIK